MRANDRPEQLCGGRSTTGFDRNRGHKQAKDAERKQRKFRFSLYDSLCVFVHSKTNKVTGNIWVQKPKTAVEKPKIKVQLFKKSILYANEKVEHLQHFCKHVCVSL